jgi:site-specific DNA-methyltransferase (adenine-specific)
MPEPITENTLFYGDNLPILREHIPDASMDLIYLDPPFNSNRTYNVLFKDESGEDSEAQIAAFEDTWHWNRAAESTYEDLGVNGPLHVGKDDRGASRLHRRESDDGLSGDDDGAPRIVRDFQWIDKS